jgi:hypothetical protein
MKQLYRILAYAVACGVVAQAMVMVYAIGSLQKWVGDGGVYDSSVADDSSAYSGAGAFRIHEIAGTIVLPSLIVLLLIVALLTRTSRGLVWPAVMFLLVAVQAMLGYLVADQPLIGTLHGLIAFLLFAIAMRAGAVPAADSRSVSPNVPVTSPVTSRG